MSRPFRDLVNCAILDMETCASLEEAERHVLSALNRVREGDEAIKRRLLGALAEIQDALGRNRAKRKTRRSSRTGRDGRLFG